MTDRPTNDEREALIAAARDAALEPDEAAELTLLADLLADPSTWVEPDAELEDAIVHAVATAPPSVARARRQAVPQRWRIAFLAVAAAAVLAIVFGVVAAQRGTTSDFTAALGPTDLAPNAHASADVVRNNAGFRITLAPHGLPPLPAGEYYQAWLKNAAGTLVPIGTFSSDDGRITLWSGVSPKDFPTLTVTIEETDNDQASSGRRVLVGEVHAD